MKKIITLLLVIASIGFTSANTITIKKPLCKVQPTAFATQVTWDNLTKFTILKQNKEEVYTSFSKMVRDIKCKKLYLMYLTLWKRYISIPSNNYITYRDLLLVDANSKLVQYENEYENHRSQWIICMKTVKQNCSWDYMEEDLSKIEKQTNWITYLKNS